MYRWKSDGSYNHIGASIQKSIRIDAETEKIISGMAGRSFSDKIRNLAKEYTELKKDNTKS